MSAYNRFFAGTYYYMLKMENRGVFSDRLYYAISGILLIVVSEALLIWGVSLLFFDGDVMSGKVRMLGLGAALLLANGLLFLPRMRFRKVVRQHMGDRKRVMAFAIVLHVVALMTFFIPVLLRISRMP